jgi:hypothetical protein
MPGKIRNFYAGGNTATGFYSLYESVLKGLNRLFILKGGPGTGKSSLMKDIAERIVGQNLDVELLHCSSDNQSVDGLIIPSLGVGIVDGTSPHSIDPKYPGVVEEIINLGDSWNDAQLNNHRDEIIGLTDQITGSFETAYLHYAKAKEIHLEREAVYLAQMNFARANEVTDKLLDSLYSEVERNGNISPLERHMFFGAATPEGVVHFIDNLTEGLKRRVIIKGRPGSGKSTMLKKIAARAKELGMETEVYHCGFDPNSLDMVIVPQLKFAVLDGTAPHEMEVTRDGDEIIDMYHLCFQNDVDQDSAAILNEIVSRYTEQTRLGTKLLAEAKSFHDELERIYIDAMDFNLVNEHKEYIASEIEKML